jgi:hypothetical protein
VAAAAAAMCSTASRGETTGGVASVEAVVVGVPRATWVAGAGEAVAVAAAAEELGAAATPERPQWTSRQRCALSEAALCRTVVVSTPRRSQAQLSQLR